MVELRLDMHTQRRILLSVSDLLDARGTCVAHDAVICLRRGDLRDHLLTVLLVDHEVDRLHVNIPCRPTETLASKQDPAFEYGRVLVGGLNQKRQEPLKRIQGENLLQSAALLSDNPMQRTEGLLGGYVKISSAVRGGPLARGNNCAIANSFAGCDLGRFSQLRSDSMPVPYPAIPRNLNASTIDRSAE